MKSNLTLDYTYVNPLTHDDVFHGMKGKKVLAHDDATKHFINF